MNQRNEVEQTLYDAKQLIAELPPSPQKTKLILASCRAEHPGLLGEQREMEAINILASL